MGFAGAIAWIMIMIGLYLFFPFENFMNAPDEFYVIFYVFGFGLPTSHIIRLAIENASFENRSKKHFVRREVSTQKRNDIGGHRHFHHGRLDETQRNNGNHLS